MRGVSTSTYGLGWRFNERLMMYMARAGRGNGYYGEKAEDLMEPFHQEFDLLSSLVSREVKMSIVTLGGIGATVENRYPQDPDGSVLLPDLAYDGEAWALVNLRIPARVLEIYGVNDTITVLEVVIQYVDMDGRLHSLPPAKLTLRFLRDPDFSALVEDQLVRQRAGELMAARYQDEISMAADSHDWAEVDRLLSEARYLSFDNPWIRDVLKGLERLARVRDHRMLSKEAFYSSSRMRSRLASKWEYGEDLSGLREDAKASFLRRKSRQGKAGGYRKLN